MTKTFRLMVEHDVLYFPNGGADFNVSFDRVESMPSMLIRSYPAGDCDAIPFPMLDESDAENLAHALFSERECNPFFPSDAIIELPDGTVFDLNAPLGQT